MNRIFKSAILGIFILLLQSCIKDKEPTYDPSGKCGSVMSSVMYSSLPIVWTITVSMDDGHTYKTVSSTSYSLGARVCF